MRLNFKTAIVPALALLAVSCATEEKEEPVDMAKVRTEIQALEDGFAAGEKAKDANAVAAYYADDAISYSSNKPPISGKAAIKDSIAARIARDTSGNTSSYKIVDLFGEGDHIVEVGAWTETNAAGEEVNKGHYMSYFQKRDGKYLCVRDMSVSSAPYKW